MKEVIFSQEELNEKLEEWQRRLRLQDWIVTASICRASEMEDDSQGVVHLSLNHKMGSINILDPIDYDKDSMIPQDMENTLVHELLHLHFEPLSNEDRDVEEEQAINSIASGLIAALRE